MINHYLQTGEGSLPDIINGMGAWYIWDTEDFREFLEWVREFNLNQPADERVHFHGMDITDPYFGIQKILNTPDQVSLNALLDEQDRDQLARVFEAPIWSTVMQRYAEFDELEFTQISDTLNRIASAVEELDTAVTDELQSDLRAVLQAHQMFSLARTEYVEAGLYRDRAMSENLALLVESRASDERYVVWSHNLHVATGEIEMSIPDRPAATITPLGTVIRSTTDIDYVAIGFSFLDGVPEWGLPPHHDGTLDSALSELDQDLFFIDLNRCRIHAACEWLSQSQAMRAQGGTANLVPLENFNGIVFVRTIDRSRPSDLAQRRFREIGGG